MCIAGTWIKLKNILAREKYDRIPSSMMPFYDQADAFFSICALYGNFK